MDHSETRALIAEADERTGEWSEPSSAPADVRLVRRLADALRALSVPDTDNRDVRERLVEYLRTQNVFQGDMNAKIAEEQASKILAILAAFPVLSGVCEHQNEAYLRMMRERDEAVAALSRDIAGEIEAEAEETEAAIQDPYDFTGDGTVQGLRRASEIVRNGR